MCTCCPSEIGGRVLKVKIEIGQGRRFGRLKHTVKTRTVRTMRESASNCTYLGRSQDTGSTPSSAPDGGTSSSQVYRPSTTRRSRTAYAPSGRSPEPASRSARVGSLVGDACAPPCTRAAPPGCGRGSTSIGTAGYCSLSQERLFWKRVCRLGDRG